MIEAPFDMGDVFRSFEVSKRISVVLKNQNGEIMKDFGDCSFFKSDIKNGFAFAFVSKLECIEFYTVQKQKAHVYIYSLGDKQPMTLGLGEVKSRMGEEAIEHVFTFDDSKLIITAYTHHLKVIMTEYESYLEKPGDALGIKWLNIRNQIDRFKFDIANRVFNVARIEGDNIVEKAAANLHSMKMGGPEDFTIEISGVYNDKDTMIQINVCDENENAPSSNFKSLSFSVGFASSKDINTLRGCEIERHQDEHFITYFFQKGNDSVAFIIQRNKGDDSDETYEMFSGIEYQ